MEKPKIVGISKQEGRVCVILEKKQVFVKAVREFLKEMGFEFWQYEELFNSPYGIKKECVDEKISGIVDEHHWYRNDNYDVDLVVGEKKVFLTVYSRGKDLQQEISENMFKFFDLKDQTPQ